MPLETERLQLRPLALADVSELFRYAADPRVGPQAGWPAHKNVGESQEIIKNVLSKPETFAIVLKETGLPVGAIGLQTGQDTNLTEASNECELGYWVGFPHWGKGLVTEAGAEIIRHGFQDLGMSTIWCSCHESNYGSKRVQEKLGFIYHHTRSGVPFPLINEVRTCLVSRLLKSEWEEGTTLQ